MIAILTRLAAAGVTLYVKDGRLRFQAADGVYTAELRDLVDANRLALIEALTIPTDSRARAGWLGRYTRLAGVGAQGLFDLIDASIGPRVLGPYELTGTETEKVAALLRAEVGKRRPIVDPQVVGGAGAEMDGNPIPRSIELTKRRGWSDRQFAALCQRVLHRPGLRSDTDDQEVHAVMLREGGDAR